MRCRDGFQWDGSRCLQANPGYSLDVFDLIVPSGSSRTLSPKVFFQGSQIQNAFFRYSGFLQTESANPITIQGSPVGRHQLTINAFRSTGSQSEFLTSKEIEI